MSVIRRIVDFLLGKNGCDHEKNEQTVRRLKDESIEFMGKARENFEETKYAFEDMDVGGDESPRAPDDPLDQVGR